MTAFTSTQSGDWNNAATWGGGGFPNSAADTATIAAKHTVTIPAGVTIACGAISLTAGTAYTATNFTSLTNNGTLEMAGQMTLNNWCELRMGPGAVLDLNGNNVTSSAAVTCRYVFAGTAESRITILSTGTRGIFNRTTGAHSADWRYVDVSGLGDLCVFARGDSNNLVQHYRYCTFDNMGSFYLEFTNAAAGAGLLVSHCDFKTPADTAPITNGKFTPRAELNGTLGVNPRRFEYCTWRTTRGANSLFTQRHDGGMVYDSCIFNDVQLSGNDQEGNLNSVFINCLFYTDRQVQFFASSGKPGTLYHGNYFLNRYGDHPLGSQAFLSQQAFANVFETDALTNLGAVNGSGTNWFLFGASAATPTIKLRNNVVIGTGSFVTFTASDNPTLVEISYNTFAVENNGTIQGTRPVYYAPIYTHEQVGACGGTIEIFNNLVLDMDTTDTRDYAVDPLLNTADQIDYLNYNCGYGYPAGTLTPPVRYSDYVVVTAGVGVNDFSANPQLVGKDRNFLGYIAAIGGTATYAAAMAEFLKVNEVGYNPAYSVKKLVDWVMDGFRVAAPELSMSGRNSMSVGAGNYIKPTRSLVAADSMRTYLDAAYA